MNIIEFLDEYGVRHWEEGKNVSKGWTNIQCLFCSDRSNHLGIRLNDLRVSCWSCGAHDIVDVVMEIADCDIKEAKSIISTLRKGSNRSSYYKPQTDIDKKLSSCTKLPSEATEYFPRSHIKYLEHRGFDSHSIIKHYRLLACHTIGRYKFRIIIPIYNNNRLVCFTSRDITDQQEPKYLHGSPSEVLLSAKRTIYNYDSIMQHGDTIIVEGPLDVWKMGDGTVCLFGTTQTEEQLKLLLKKQIRNCFVFFDNERKAQYRAHKVARSLSPVVKNIELISLKTKGDPGELSYAEAELIKKNIRFKGGSK